MLYSTLSKQYLVSECLVRGIATRHTLQEVLLRIFDRVYDARELLLGHVDALQDVWRQVLCPQLVHCSRLLVRHGEGEVGNTTY